MNEQNNKPRKPEPNQGIQPRNPRPINNKNAQNKSVRDARVPDEFQQQKTAVFNKINTGRQQSRPNDGEYNYTGRNIKSNRQRFAANADENITVKKKREKKKREDAEPRGGGIMSGVFKAILYIVGVLAVSGIIAYNAIMITNDVFAFLKDTSVVELTLPHDADIDNISRLLAEHNLIRYPGIFRLYANLRSRNRNWEFQGGETFVLSADMPYDEFIRQFRMGATQRQVITLTFPEGWTIDQIINRLVENGVGTRARYEYIINNHAFGAEYEFLRPLYESEFSPHRRYVLEGYLFPDTYNFFTDEHELSVIRKFLDNFQARFDVRSFERLNILGMSLDELVTLASIIEREARHPEDFSRVSAVFHNRLQNSAAFPFLQSDATILYDTSIFTYHRDVTPDDLHVTGASSPWNTYHSPGLPPSAIVNPGMGAIHAALEPYEDYLGLYFFFVSSRVDGTKLYARDLAQHTENINIMRARDEELLAEAGQ